MKSSPILFAIYIAALVGCSPSPAGRDANNSPAPVTYQYACGDKTLTVDFHGEGDAILAMGELKLRLPHVPSGSGARYADVDGNEFFGKGRSEAMLTLKGQPPVACYGKV